MTEEEAIIEGISSVATPIFLLLIAGIALRQLDRVMRHRLMGRESPELLIRDVVFFWTLAILLVVPAVAGIFNETLNDKVVWVVLRTSLGLAALVVFAFYEFFRIGREAA